MSDGVRDLAALCTARGVRLVAHGLGVVSIPGPSGQPWVQCDLSRGWTAEDTARVRRVMGKGES